MIDPDIQDIVDNLNRGCDAQGLPYVKRPRFDRVQFGLEDHCWACGTWGFTFQLVIAGDHYPKVGVCRDLEACKDRLQTRIFQKAVET